MRVLGTLVALAALASAGCTVTQPIQNVEQTKIVAVPPGKKLSLNQVSTAILRAGTELGWQMHPVSPGRISGKLAIREHIAVVEVEHDTKAYSIKYRDSTNLSARDGMIHRTYNSWVQNLDRRIRAELMLL